MHVEECDNSLKLSTGPYPHNFTVEVDILVPALQYYVL